MTDKLLNDVDEQKVVFRVRKWLGHIGIEYFRQVKDMHGTVDAFWMEPMKADMIVQWIPRSVKYEEGEQLRRFLKTLKECQAWGTKDFENQWIPIIEKCLEE